MVSCLSSKHRKSDDLRRVRPGNAEAKSGLRKTELSGALGETYVEWLL